MEWCQHGVAEAVQLCKERNVIFMVFIDGKNPDSERLQSLLDNPLVANRLNNTARFLSIRIDGASETFKQFVQIYRLVPTPSIFFIGAAGQPIEIIAQVPSTAETLLERIEVAEQAFYGSTNESVHVATVANEEGVLRSEGADDAASSSTTDTVEAKLDKAKKLIEQKRIEREEEEKEREKARELERRRLGKDMATLKKIKEDQELKQLKEDRKREKMEEEEARKRVLEQIKLDRLERQQRFAPVSTEKEIRPELNTGSAPKAPTVVGGTARIQFRKPDGNSVATQFSNSATFGEIRDYVRENVLMGDTNFGLATTFPRREFKTDDDSKTLIELQLVPSAVLLIIPMASASRARLIPTAGVSSVIPRAGAGFGAMLVTVFWTLVTPVLSVWTYLKGFVARGGNGGPTDDAGAQKRASEDALSHHDIAKRRNLERYNIGPVAGNSKDDQPQPSKPYKRTSNIHRLHENNDSDEDNNTWNGNSTQQM